MRFRVGIYLVFVRVYIVIFKDVHKRFKKLEMYSILKIFSYVFVIIGFLSALEIFYILIDSNLRPIGEIFAVILPEIVTETRSNSLYPVVVYFFICCYFICYNCFFWNLYLCMFVHNVCGICTMFL